MSAKPQPGGPQPAPVAQRLRVRYAKQGRFRFASHRDLARAFERAVRRAGVPVAFSAGFTPHPKISYAGAAPTCVASQAEYLEIGVTRPCDPERIRADLDAALPDGVDVIDVTVAGPVPLAELLTASEWEVRLPGVEEDVARAAAARFLAAETVEVERLTTKGTRRFDARCAVVGIDVLRRARDEHGAPCAILRMVVQQMTPAVRPDDVLTGLRLVADLAPPSPPMVTRLAQGPLDAIAGGLADPFAAAGVSAGGGLPGSGPEVAHDRRDFPRAAMSAQEHPDRQ